MLTLIRRHRWWFFALTLAAIALRLYFVFKLKVIDGDTLIYGELARGLVQHHTLGMERTTGWYPSLIRLPGYPLFLAFTFLITGVNHYTLAMLIQVVFDVLTAYLVADIARRLFSARAALWAFALTALCPFLMSYVATPLTECLEIFCTAAALDFAILGLDRRQRRWWIACGVACSGAILLRPDGGLVLGCIGLPLLYYLWRERSRRRELLIASLLLGCVSLAPLVPWTVRNWYSLHVFQPLVDSHAIEPGEFLPVGWNRWFQSWMIDYSSVEDIGFKVPSEPIDINDVPERAYATPEQREKVRQLFEQYNTRMVITPELDRQFGALADESIRLHPLRFHLLMPAARMLDMWFRPRIEMLPLDTHWWNYQDDPVSSAWAIAAGLLNLAYIAAAALAAWLLRRRVRYLSLLLCYPLVRSLFLATTGGSEDRYTMECYPMVIVLAACLLGYWLAGRKHEEPAA